MCENEVGLKYMLTVDYTLDIFRKIAILFKAIMSAEIQYSSR
jgi:hypothetical protein